MIEITSALESSYNFLIPEKASLPAYPTRRWCGESSSCLKHLQIRSANIQFPIVGGAEVHPKQRAACCGCLFDLSLPAICDHRCQQQNIFSGQTSKAAPTTFSARSWSPEPSPPNWRDGKGSSTWKFVVKFFFWFCIVVEFNIWF